VLHESAEGIAMDWIEKAYHLQEIPPLGGLDKHCELVQWKLKIDKQTGDVVAVKKRKPKNSI
jgi:hypothetical protein